MVKRRFNKFYQGFKTKLNGKQNDILYYGIVFMTAFCLVSCAGMTPDLTTSISPGLIIETVSTPADLISGGNALVRIINRKDYDLEKLVIRVNGIDITILFRPALPDRLGRLTDPSLLGLVTDLAIGDNILVVLDKRKTVGQLKITNHPITGPIISGPHQQPFICQTIENGLGPALDGNCSAETIVTYAYKSTEPPPPFDRTRLMDMSVLTPGFKPYDPSEPRPPDMAQVTTTEGQTVDYIVRRERGTINRSVYEIAILNIPGEPLPTPWTTSPGWNGRLVFSFGGGTAAGYRQALLRDTLNDNALSGGYAVAAASLCAFGNTADDVISAETMMMVKEYFIEKFGPPVHTIGYGGSGGSMQQHLIAQNYPGLLDGLTPTVSFPDHLSVFFSSVDCTLLSHAIEGASQPWTEEQKRAVSGFATWQVCGRTWTLSSAGLLMSTRCNRTVPQSLVYHPETNPAGARCGIHDNMVNLFGRDPDTGFAYRPIDNVGVQYGLVAFNEGKITAEQFLELNERIGGHDVDGNVIDKRNVVDPEALRRTYSYGRINSGGGSLGSIPIIDARGYSDPVGDIHDSYRSFVTRARIAAANGQADNHIILRLPRSGGLDAPRTPPPFSSIRLMDEWLNNLAKDSSSDSHVVKLARSKPAGISDACWTEAGEKIVEPANYTGNSKCNQMYPPFGDPRIAAGGPLTDDVIKCALKPVDPKDYTQPLAEAQLERLRSIFPEGVCDYSRPGIEQTVVKETWKRY